MVDMVGSIEEARLSARMSQSEVADALGVTQGHYSKVVTSKVPLSEALSDRMRVWLSAKNTVPIGDDATRRVRELASSICRECMELMHLVGLAMSAEQTDEIPVAAKGKTT